MLHPISHVMGYDFALCVVLRFIDGDCFVAAAASNAAVIEMI